ncbi:MAG: radical SAM protein [Deltaproteobacteria bacterium]|nr:radical SAM protein [Deltaproteobacteria bacterium]
MEDRVLSATESICPVCLERIPAHRILRGEDVFLQKTCSRHGLFETPIWRGEPSLLFWTSPRIPSYPKHPLTEVRNGCPWDCGLCPDHRQHTCTALLEVTCRCNLKCAFCFADSHNSRMEDPGISTIKTWYEQLLRIGGPYNIQLSGGEPTLRDDLPEIIALGRSLGFSFIQVNTNGLRLAQEPSFVKDLAQAGLASVFLQFDGVTDDVYQKLRGRPLLKEKERAVELCALHEIGVILVPTLVPGTNTHQIGSIIDFALHHMPAVRGVHFQPVSYFGRFPTPPADRDRITIPEVIREIEKQTAGKIKAGNFKPPGCENALCSFHGNFVQMPDGKLAAWTRHDTQSSCCKAGSAEKGAEKARQFVAQFWTTPAKEAQTEKSQNLLGEWEVFARRTRTHSICISGMAFQDAWNLDLERLRDCCIHVMHPDGRIIPFCAYNITSANGETYYRKQHLP